MKINVSDIASTINELGIPFEAQSRYLVAALARVLAYMLPIPANNVAGTPGEMFQSTYGAQVTAALDALNERMPVDYQQVLELTQKIWEVRYHLVHPNRDAQAWAAIDCCVQKANLGFEIDFTDAALQRLGQVITQGVEG